jgi:hypothetical protein
VGEKVNTNWLKSTRCSASNGCVEVRLEEASTELVNADQRHVMIRDSKDASGPTLKFTADEWRSFIAGARSGEFDL